MQRPHQQTPEAFPQRVGRDQLVQPTDHGRVLTEGQPRPGERLDRGDPLLDEAAPLGLGQGQVRQVGVWLASPQLQRAGQSGRCPLRAPLVHALGDKCLEVSTVHVGRHGR